MSTGIMRQHEPVARARLRQGAASEPIPLNGRAHYRPGILIFSRRQKLLHASRRALELTGHLDQSEIGPVHEIRSVPVHELRYMIQAALDHRREANIWEIFELKRVIFEERRKILVRGFGLADRSSHEDSRIVIVLEELGLRQELSEPVRLAMGPSHEGDGPVVRGSAQRGSDRGVFDTCMYGAP